MAAPGHDGIEDVAGLAGERTAEIHDGGVERCAAAAEEADAVGFPGPRIRTHEGLREPWPVLVEAARAAAGEQDGSVLIYRGLDEEFGKRGVASVAHGVVERDLGVAGEFDFAWAGRLVR